MPLAPAIVLALASQCAPSIAPSTMVSVVRVESAFDPLVIGVNGAARSRIHPNSQTDAVATATRLIASGANIDLGLGQINSTNLTPLGLTVAEAFDPCRNLQAAAEVLRHAYQSQEPIPGQEQAALRTALSIYNTGRTDRGFRNGYVAKVTAAARMAVPPLNVSSPSASVDSPPAWNVFARADGGTPIVFTSEKKARP